MDDGTLPNSPNHPTPSFLMTSHPFVSLVTYRDFLQTRPPLTKPFISGVFFDFSRIFSGFRYHDRKCVLILSFYCYFVSKFPLINNHCKRLHHAFGSLASRRLPKSLPGIRSCNSPLGDEMKVGTVFDLASFLELPTDWLTPSRSKNQHVFASLLQAGAASISFPRRSKHTTTNMGPRSGVSADAFLESGTAPTVPRAVRSSVTPSQQLPFAVDHRPRKPESFPFFFKRVFLWTGVHSKNLKTPIAEQFLLNNDACL